MNWNKYRRDMILICIGMLIFAVIYLIDYFFFGGFIEDISAFLVNLAYIPIAIILQTFVFDKLLEKREQAKAEKKIVALIGFFYAELGNEILSMIAPGDNNIGELRNNLKPQQEWTEEHYKKIVNILENYRCNINIEKLDIFSIGKLLDSKDELIVQLFINPLMSDYGSFGTLLMSLLHLREELQRGYYKENFTEDERSKIVQDLCASYRYLIKEWIKYVKYLNKEYPFMFAKALVYSPFNEGELCREQKYCIY